MHQHRVVFTTERGLRHQRATLAAAPDYLDVTMLRQPDKDTLLPHLADAEYLISERVGVIDAGMMQAAPHLKLIVRLGSLTYDIDTRAAQAAGIKVCYWPSGGVIRVAEHVVLQILALGKRLRQAETIVLAASPEWGASRRTDEDTFTYNWSHRQNLEGIWQKSVGIMGFGEIGVELARRLQGWGCTVTYHKRRRLPQSVETGLGLCYADVDTLFATSDYLVNLLPYFPTTDLMIDAGYFDKMKEGACLVSCGSGSVIDENALAEAVKSGKLGGAALDTFEWEPIRADNPLLALARSGYNVLLTPHIAAGASAALVDERAENYTNIIRHLKGEPIFNRVV